MPFELSLRYTTPLTPIHDLDEVLTEFLRMVGYLPPAEDGRSGEGPTADTVGFRLVRECLLKDASRPWYAEELAAMLKTSKPTVYRHINKLKSLDLLEEVGGAEEGKGRKGYRFRYGNISRAWDFTEANATNALRRYRETVNHLQTLVEAAPHDAAMVETAGARAPARERGGRR
ncbi:MAG TPA: helix-turn-helix domain-containing protein [Thermoplasmata archaeon]|nr:helix-turn-helix domain-containing protein [Thermoplasmata archaeon]